MVLSPKRCQFAYLFRMPYSASTLAANILEHKAGALHVDACRIRWQGEADRAAGKPGSMPGEQQKIFHTPDRSHLDPDEKQNSIGRWPTNVVFIHGPRCRVTGTTKAPGARHCRYDEVRFCNGADGHEYTTTDGGEEDVPIWECHPGCPVAELDAQSGITKGSTTPVVRDKPSTFNAAATLSISQAYGDVGGASRYYPQFACELDLLEWFTLLLTPDGGTVFRGI
jgi:hypothetical protein